MDSTAVAHVDAPVRYLLASRLSTDGKVLITLQLYRGDFIASISPVVTIERAQAADIVSRCRRHLSRLGVESMPYNKPSRVLSQHDAKPADRLPTAMRLVVKPAV